MTKSVQRASFFTIFFLFTCLFSFFYVIFLKSYGETADLIPGKLYYPHQLYVNL